MKPTTVIQFQPGTDMDGTGWHISENPTGNDTTLCGLALEGMCATRKPVKQAFKSKQGLPTCTHCKSIVEFCLTLK